MPFRLISLMFVATSIALTSRSVVAASSFEGETKDWHGFKRYDFTVDSATSEVAPLQPPAGENFAVGDPPPGKQRAIVVVPAHPAPGNPWSWRGCYWDHEPQAEVELLKRGFHVAFITSDPGKEWEAWFDFLTQQHGLSTKPAFVGMSRGGINAYTWSAAHPDKVGCIYADNPAIRPEAFARLDELARRDVPLLNVCGSLDYLLERGTLRVENRYHELGGRISVLIKEGVPHHPHSLINPKLIADWIETSTLHSSPPAPPCEPPEGEMFVRSSYYALRDTYLKLEEEKTYATCRGPLFTPCYPVFQVHRSLDDFIQGMTIIAPTTVAAGLPWVFRADVVGRDATVEQALLAKGYHIVVAPLTEQSGPTMALWNHTYQTLTAHGFSKRPVVAGSGAAAGDAYAWAIANPDKVACLYAENPVMRSVMTADPLLDHLAPLARAGVPLLHLCGALDPWLQANTGAVERRYKELGGPITVLIQQDQGHFPLAPADPSLALDFVLQHTR